MMKQPTQVQREYWENRLRQYNLGEERAAKPRRYGPNGNVDLNVQLTPADMAVKQAPPNRCFDFYAVSPDRWKILFVATELLQNLARVTYKHSVSPNETGNGLTRQFCSCGCSRKGPGSGQDRNWSRA
jgi:hypothetical protein